MLVRLVMLGCLLALAAPAAAQDQDNDKPITYEEQVVVTASRTEQQLVNAPAAVSVVSSETIQNSPAMNIGDLLRTVPGLNVSQVSARDINLTTRGATSTLATSQLALVDGRSIYLDFFGMVLWDLVPTTMDEVKQIEVIRGPASAVWGANAMSGVVNVITKSPRELAASGASSFTIGIGAFDRSVGANDADTGSLYSVMASHAHAIDSKWAFKVTAGYLSQDPLPRPTGTIPNVFRTPYPPFTNQGTAQPKFDGRLDYDMESGGKLTFAGGVAATEGIVHSGVGPFDIHNGSRLNYFTTRYTKGGRRVAFFTNLLSGDAENLLSFTQNGRPLQLIFDTKTFDVEASDVKAIGTKNVVSFGGNFRHNTFDISLAPNGEDRNEGGGFIQDEVFISDRVRWVIGGRLDKFSSIENAVFSPRTTLMLKPSAAQTVRFSFNQAFRAPSFINNNIDTTILNEVNLSALSPALARFIFPIRATGNTGLEQETLTAYEIGYTGVLNNRATVSAAVYWNTTENGIFFTPIAVYSPASPPPGWPLPPAILGVLAGLTPPVVLPSRFTYLNLGTVNDRGVELAIDLAVNNYVNAFANYSHQRTPTIENFPAGTSILDVNLPANNRFNTGFNFNVERLVGNLSISYTDEAYWQDVLDLRFAGTSPPYTLINLGLGVRWARDKVTTSLKVTNLANVEAMQHIFGDIVKRQVVGELRVRF